MRKKQSIESIDYRYKGGTFAPARANKFIRILTGFKEVQDQKLFLKINQNKACEIRNCLLHLHPAKHAKFLERLVREDKENEDLHLQKKL